MAKTETAQTFTDALRDMVGARVRVETVAAVTAFQGTLEAIYADGGLRIADETRNQVVVAPAAIASVHRLGA